MSTLQSVAVRRERLVPLATALEAQPGNDAKEVARMARQVAATQANIAISQLIVAARVRSRL